jgi:hypothetical protein
MRGEVDILALVLMDRKKVEFKKTGLTMRKENRNGLHL